MRSAFRIDRACHALRQGGILAYPTEGVWGLGCDPLVRQSVLRLLELKAREVHKGLILVGAHPGQFGPWLSMLDDNIRREILASWPGPITWIVPNHGIAPAWITGKHSGIAIRVTSHPLVAALCKRFAAPIVSTSANPSSRPAALSELQVRRYFGNSLDYLLPGKLGTHIGTTCLVDAVTGRTLRS